MDVRTSFPAFVFFCISGEAKIDGCLLRIDYGGLEEEVSRLDSLPERNGGIFRFLSPRTFLTDGALEFSFLPPVPSSRLWEEGKSLNREKE